MLDAIRDEWRCFRDDRPGQRFQNHHDRAHRRGKASLALEVGLGAVLLGGGVVMLFIPGPGLLFMLFGVALLGTLSSRLSRLLDRCEPRARRLGGRGLAWWRAASTPMKAALVLAALSIVAAAAAVTLPVMLGR